MPEQLQKQITRDPLDVFKKDFENGGYPRLAKLPKDRDGNLIGILDRLTDSYKDQKACLDEHCCSFCGNALQPGEYYFLLDRFQVEKGKAFHAPFHIECAYYKLSTYSKKDAARAGYDPKEIYLLGVGEYQFNPSKKPLQLEYKNLLMKLIYKYDEEQQKLVLL